MSITQEAADGDHPRGTFPRTLSGGAVPAVRIPMRQVVEALRLAFDQGRSQREIAQALRVSQSTINEYRSRFAASGLTWSQTLPGWIAAPVAMLEAFGDQWPG